MLFTNKSSHPFCGRPPHTVTPVSERGGVAPSDGRVGTIFHDWANKSYRQTSPTAKHLKSRERKKRARQTAKRIAICNDTIIIYRLIMQTNERETEPEG